MRKVTKDQLIHFLKQKISTECNTPLEHIQDTDRFDQLNMDSMSAIMVMDALEDFLQMELSPLYFWDNPTLDSYASFIIGKMQNPVI